MSQSLPAPSPETERPPEAGRRRQKLIKPGIQLRLSGVFAGLSVLCLVIQWLLFSSMLSNAAHKMPIGGDYLLDLVPTLLFRSLFFSLAIALPLTMLVGVHSTFRITGPIYRFESFLKEVIRGKQLGPCKIRKGDLLGDLCELINGATEPQRRRVAETTGAAETTTKSEDEAA